MCSQSRKFRFQLLTFNISYEEDREDNSFDEDDPLWFAAHGDACPRRRHLNGSAIHSDSDSDDDVIEIRPSSYRHPKSGTPYAKKKAPSRSKSASSSSSITTSTTSSASSSTGFRQRRKSASAALDDVFPSDLLSVPLQTSAYRPRPSHPDPPYRDRVTIAPIAPTFLKTTGAWEEGFGDEDGISDDGLWDYGVPRHGVDSRSGESEQLNKKNDEEQSSDNTPVELVYVPPFGSIYGYGAQAYWRNRREQAQGMEDEEDEMTEDVEELESQFAPLVEAPKNEDSFASTSSIPQQSTPPFSRSPVPAVIVDSSSDSEFIPRGSDWNECNSSSSNFTSAITAPVSLPPRRLQLHEEERGRSRGRSLSVSPIGGASSDSKAPVPSSSSSNDGLLTSGGRFQSCQDLQSFYNPPVATTSVQSGERRGRSSTRGSIGSNPASIYGINLNRSSQSHSSGGSGGSVSPYNSSTSPISSSISPDGGDTRPNRGIGSAYASGRIGGRERESWFERNSSSSGLGSKAASAEERRGRDRGTRDIGSGSGSSVSPATGTRSLEESRGRSMRDRGPRPSPEAALNVEPALGSKSSSPGTIIALGVPGRDVKESSTFSVEDGLLTNDVPKMEMDASICSVSSEGSTATIVPTSNVVSPQNKVVAQTLAPDGPSLSRSLQSDTKRQIHSEREALEEADNRKKDVPTPSNLLTISMTTPIITCGSAPVTNTTPLTRTESIEYSPKHVRITSSPTYPSNSSSSSKYKPKPLPIAPSPPHPALSSTSSSHAPGEVGTSGISTYSDCVRSASASLERTSPGSRERQSSSCPPVGSSLGGNSIPYADLVLREEISPNEEFERELVEARRGRSGGVNGKTAEIWIHGNGDSVVGAPREPTLPVVDGGHSSERGTIINKAMGMMSSAYLKLWPGQSSGAGAAQ